MKKIDMRKAMSAHHNAQEDERDLDRLAILEDEETHATVTHEFLENSFQSKPNLRFSEPAW